MPSLQDAINRLQSYSTQKYGQFDSSKLGDLGASIGYSGSGDLTDDQYNAAQAGVDRYYGGSEGPVKPSTADGPTPTSGAGPAVPPNAPVAPNGQIPPYVPQAGGGMTGEGAKAGLQDYAKGKGGSVSDQQIQEIANKLGYTGGEVSGGMYNQALALLDQILRGKGGGAPPGSSTYIEPGAGPGQGYQAGNITQFTPRDFGAQDQALLGLFQQILQNPSGLDPMTLQAMKERNKEEALAYGKGLQGQAQQNAASRGTYGGGQLAANERRIGQDMISQVLRGNRDVDIYGAEKAAAGRFQALGAGEGLLSSMTGRDIANYQGMLGGQMAQEELRQAAAQSSLGNRQLSVQDILARLGLRGEQDRLAESLRQYNLANQLDWARFWENSRQFNEGMGFNYSGLGQDAYNRWLQAVTRGS